MTAFYTYLHTRNDSNSVFYVGKGTGNRAYTMEGRNPEWYKIAAMRGYTVKIIERFESENDAYALERYLISSFRACGVPICNIADGGIAWDRASGRPKGPPSIATCVRMTEDEYAAYLQQGGAKWLKGLMVESFAMDFELS